MMASSLVVTPAMAKKYFSEKELSEVFRKPLIVGASISADKYAVSPSRKLSLRYTSAPHIMTKAQSGKSAVTVLPTVPERAFEDRTVILGMDLFFWDSTLANLDNSLKELDRLVALARKHNIPLILGEVPLLIPGYQKHQPQIRKALLKASESYDKCYLIPFEKILAQLMKDHYLKVKGKRYEFFELIPDGLHINDIASDFVADIMRDLVMGRTVEINGADTLYL